MYADDAEGRLAALIAQVSLERSRAIPASKAAPYFGLDNDKPYDLAVLEALSSPGIFRKYELVLLIRSGLGGTARWLSGRLGCRVLGIDRDRRRTAAAQALNRRARLTGKVSFAVAEPERLAFRDRVFTHVWLIDPPSAYGTPQALREAYRVLRSGAHFALQTTATGHARRSFERELTATGFVDLRFKHTRLAPPDHATLAARARMAQSLEGHEDLRRAWGEEPLTAVVEATQIFCRRP